MLLTTDISNSYLYRLDRLASTFHTILDQRLRLQGGVSLAHCVLLTYVGQNKSATQQQIAGFLDITPGAVSRQVEVLRKNGWLTTQEDNADHRKQLLTLTPAGKKIVDHAYGNLKELSDELLEGTDRKIDLDTHITLLQDKIDSIKNH
jgi:DNA-binding MarR family transcriptional regulator